MKIALLTIWHEYNYGAELQAYALQRVLKELGNDIQLINIRLDDINNVSAKNKISKFIRAFTPCHLKFVKFWKSFFSLTRRYKSVDELYADPPKADLFIVGSDQVWNQSITKKAASVFFLDFVKNGKIKASYASSIGNSFWSCDENVTHIALENLRQFRKISCRERTGADIIDSKFSLKADVVLDPTLLCGCYPEITGEISNANTLVYYSLSDNKKFESTAVALSNIMNLNFVNANKSRIIAKRLVWNRPSLQCWLNNIASSSFVLTQSFHGMAMSLLYQKEFAVLLLNKSKASRILDLLKALDLEDRCFYSYDDLLNSHIWEKKINYKQVSIKLKNMREYSISWLYDLVK